MRNRYQSKRRVLNVFTLAMINIAAIESLKNFPIMAKVGLEALFFYMLAAIVFFIPCGLVSAELATGFPSTGGVYTWVKKAFGERYGFVAVWLQWVENVIWYPTILSFAAATIAYLFAPQLASHKLYMLGMILGLYWLNTLFNFFGMRASGLISTIGVIIGTIIPVSLIILFGCSWFLVGDYSHLHWSWSGLFPHITNMKNLAFLVGVLLGLSGMEMSAVHAKEVENPQRDYPKAILLSSLVILITSILSALSIAIVVPSHKISLVAGVMQAFEVFFEVYRMQWAMPILALLIAIGAIAMVSTWIVGPSKGLLASAKDGDIPKIFEKMNKYHMPITIMLLQGVIVSLLTLVFLFMPNVSSSYWILTALTAQLYLLMYLLMFASAIRLRYTQPLVKRAYKIPFGNWGIWIIGGVGFLGSLFAIVVGFFPPAQLQTGNIVFYESFLGGGMVIMVLLPLVIYWFSKRFHE
ncbi:MAG: amino acid permease [Gammaproteobacteria bacterium]|nr:amino acid permease [Gammaproteobacteria bacterium]